ncbi:DeoR family transcriptional regulator, partial [Clostridium paraputrificum]
MFLEERYDKIIKMVEDKGRMSVKDLSSIFKVTEDCIRKDLRELEKRGKVKRVHGGAITNRSHNDI